MTKQKIGWIGVGAMGGPMCLNLLRAGYALGVYDRNPAHLEAVRESGADVAKSPRELAAGSDIVFSTIFDDDGLRDIVNGAEGIATGGRPKLVYVDMSTVSPAASAGVADALARRGIQYLRAPVSGTVTLAASAQLSTFVSGPREVFERVRPVLAHLTAKQSYVGPAEEARVIKLMINLLVFMSTAAIGEALTFGARAGLDRATMVDAINDSIVGSAHYRIKADKLKQREYSPAGSIALVIKDADLALNVARLSGAPLPMSSLVRQYLTVLQSRGMGQLDVSALAEVLDLLTGDIDAADIRPSLTDEGRRQVSMPVA